MEQDGTRARYEFHYDYEDFVDAKEPDRPGYAMLEPGAPSWARVFLSASCDSCGAVVKSSTQSNFGRPREVHCDCGKVLFSDEHPPRLWWTSYSAPSA